MLRLLTVVLLSVVGSGLVNCQDTADTVAFYNDQCKKIHGNANTTSYKPNSMTNYGCKFQCFHKGLFGKTTSTKSLADFAPCRTSESNVCLNRKCYPKVCVDACLNATGTSSTGKGSLGLSKLNNIFKGKHFGRKGKVYCGMSFNLFSLTTINVSNVECTLPGQESGLLPSSPSSVPTVAPTILDGASTVTEKQGPGQITGNPNKNVLNATAVCLTINKGKQKKITFFQGGCNFMCRGFTIVSANHISQKDGTSCGSNMHCLDGDCLVDSCLPACQALNATGQVRRIKQNKDFTLKCYFVGIKKSIAARTANGTNCLPLH